MYDDPKYAAYRDSAYSIFYMGICIGAFFAPSASTGIFNWMLRQNGFGYDADLPSLCHQQINGTLENTEQLRELAATVSSGSVTDLTAFANNYISVFSTGYHYAFGIAAAAMLISSIVFLFFQRILPSVKKKDEKDDSGETPQMSKAEEKKRLVALGHLVQQSLSSPL